MGTGNRDISFKEFCCNGEQRKVTIARRDVRSSECSLFCFIAGERTVWLCVDRNNLV